MTKPLSQGLIIAAPKSGSGKTTVSLGLMRALRRKGIKVMGFKSGPDYIDPAFHAIATGSPSCNLDTWAMRPDLIKALVAQKADLTLIEASMGLFDGVPVAQGHSGASADLAALLNLPVLLVVDVSGQAQSAAALVHGFAHYRQDVRVAGVVLNKVASPRHQLLTVSAIEALNIPVLGCLPPAPSLSLPERHLGLVQAEEIDGLEAKLEILADFIEEHCAVERLCALAAPIAQAPAQRAMTPPGQRLALAKDRAFSFLYPHLLAGWRAMGAEILPFSPLNNEPVPDADFCWLSGGYPELHAGVLAQNSIFLDSLRAFAARQPVYGECGGYMVLGEALIDAQGVAHAMAGLLDVTTSFAKRKMSLGYRSIALTETGALGAKGTRFTGHEFHYSTQTNSTRDDAFAIMQDAYGNAPLPIGARRAHVSGSYMHIIAQA